MHGFLNMKELVDVLFTIGLIINAIIFIPQAYRLYKHKKARDVSLVTFIGFNVIQIMSIINGYYYHDFALMIGFSASLITCGAVSVLTIYYRIKPSEVILNG